MRRPYLLTIALVASPWSWFAVRDRHPVLDTVAIGLPVIVIAVVLAALVVATQRRRWGGVIVGVSWITFGVVTVVGPWVPLRGPGPVTGLRVVGANVEGRHSDVDAVAAELASQDPDVLVVSEISRPLDDRLSARYEHVIESEPTGDSSGVTLFTNLPVTDLGLPAGIRSQRGVRVRVEGSEGPVLVYGMHLDRPRFGPSSGPQVSVRYHRRIVAALRDAAAGESLPVVVAGDLNLVDRTSGYRRLVSFFDDAMRAGWGRPTALRLVGLPFLPRIDHVLMPAGWCSTDASIFTLARSDHRGVAATVGPCP